MSNVTNRHTCVLYLTATCNLRCKYCYIDKSTVLQEIDKMLIEHYKTDYFFNFMQEIFPDPAQLTRIEFWGGEPSYGLPRVIPTIKKAIAKYYNLHHFMMSTNLTTETWLNDFFSFIRVFKEFPERKFTFNLQLSLDGPTEINDENRGLGVTELFTKNFSKLLFNIDSLLEEVPNVTIRSYFKPTLNDDSISKLQTKTALISYFQFFECYKDMSDKTVDNSRWIFSLPLPNTATPTPHTTEQGKAFANLCKLANEINAENKDQYYFKYFTNIVPFADARSKGIEKRTSLNNGACTCGTGSCVVGLLPNKLVSTCHNGFVDLIGDYKQKAMEKKEGRTLDFNFFNSKDFNNSVAFTVEDYENKYEKMANCHNRASRFSIIEYASLIQLFARLKQIDEKYENLELAKEAAHFILQVTSNCLRDNMNTTGSHYLRHPGFIKLFLNGAKEYIEDANKNFSRGTE